VGCVGCLPLRLPDTTRRRKRTTYSIRCSRMRLYESLDYPYRRTIRRGGALLVVLLVTAVVVVFIVIASTVSESRSPSQASSLSAPAPNQNNNNYAPAPQPPTTFEQGGSTEWHNDFVAETGRVGAPPSIQEDAFSSFASALAASKDLLVVGSKGATVNNVEQVGSVFVYEKESTFGPWTLVQHLFDTTAMMDTDQGLQFGSAVALSDDGDDNLIVVGAPGGDVNATNSGSAYTFVRNETNGDWQPRHRLTAPDGAANDAFGAAIAVEDEVLLVGAPMANKVYIFEQDSVTQLWAVIGTLQPPASASAAAEGFGSSMALKDGLLVVGAPATTQASATATGTVYVYRRRPNNNFAPKDTLKASDGIAGDGFAVSVATDGESILVGAPAASAAYVFEEGTVNEWTEISKLEPPNTTSEASFGTAVAVDGDLIAVTASVDGSTSSSGTAYLFIKGCRTSDGTNWAPRGQLIPADSSSIGDSFGLTAQLVDGVVFVGSSEPSAVYVFNVPIALGPTCTPTEEPSAAPTLLPISPVEAPGAATTQPTPKRGVQFTAESQMPSPRGNSCEHCSSAFGLIHGYRMYDNVFCGDVCVVPSLVGIAESFGWSCEECGKS